MAIKQSMENAGANPKEQYQTENEDEFQERQKACLQITTSLHMLVWSLRSAPGVILLKIYLD